VPKQQQSTIQYVTYFERIKVILFGTNISGMGQGTMNASF